MVKIKITKYNFYSGKTQRKTINVSNKKYKELKRKSVGKFSKVFKVKRVK